MVAMAAGFVVGKSGFRVEYVLGVVLNDGLLMEPVGKWACVHQCPAVGLSSLISHSLT